MITDLHFHHFAHFPRQFYMVPRVYHIGYIPRKTNWIHHAFDTLNFSFILSGEGTYWINGRKFRVQAPCVITQWPYVWVRYGPEGGEGVWEELYLIYGREDVSRWYLGAGISVARPIWRLSKLEVIQQILGYLTQEIRDIGTNHFQPVDRIDTLCYWLVIESLISGYGREKPHDEFKIIEIARELMNKLKTDISIQSVAREWGLSYSTFRRYWKQYFNMSPGKWVILQRLRASCQLLAETTLSIGEIAEECGFRDALYFSRCFRQYYQLSPSEYRKQHQVFPLESTEP